MANMSSGAAAWALIVARGWLAYQLTQSEFALGLVFFAVAVPMFVVAPLGGPSDPGATLDILLRGNALDQPPGRPGRTAPTPLDDHYTLSLDAHRNLVTLKRPDVWNRMPAMRSQSLDLPTHRPFKLHIMLHGDILEVFVDDRISVSARLQLPDGALALLGRDGNVSLNNLRINQLPE